MRRIGVVLACLLAATACTGDEVVPAAERSAASDAARAEVPPSSRPQPGDPRARLQAGTASVEGALVRYCREDACQRPDRPPAGVLKVADQRLLLFSLSVPPEQASVVVRPRGRDKVIDRGELLAGDLMAYEPSLRSGRYDLVLDAVWPGHRAVWRFDLRVKDA